MQALEAVGGDRVNGCGVCALKSYHKVGVIVSRYKQFVIPQKSTRDFRFIVT